MSTRAQSEQTLSVAQMCGLASYFLIMSIMNAGAWSAQGH